jgi:hypothetical protein
VGRKTKFAECGLCEVSTLRTAMKGVQGMGDDLFCKDCYPRIKKAMDRVKKWESKKIGASMRAVTADLGMR